MSRVFVDTGVLSAISPRTIDRALAAARLIDSDATLVLVAGAGHLGPDVVALDIRSADPGRDHRHGRRSIGCRLHRHLRSADVLPGIPVGLI